MLNASRSHWRLIGDHCHWRCYPSFVFFGILRYTLVQEAALMLFIDFPSPTSLTVFIVFIEKLFTPTPLLNRYPNSPLTSYIVDDLHCRFYTHFHSALESHWVVAQLVRHQPAVDSRLRVSTSTFPALFVVILWWFEWSEWNPLRMPIIRDYLRPFPLWSIDFNFVLSASSNVIRSPSLLVESYK